MLTTRSMWSPNCDTRPRNVTWLCIHTQEGNGTADSLARYLDNPANQVSYNTVGDTREVIDVVPFDKSPWAAMGANGRADHYCMAGSFSSWSRQQWINSGLIDNAARWVAERAAARRIPIAYVGTEGVKRGTKGVIGHVDWTRGAGEGSHTDPGPNFPWDLLIAKAAGGVTPSAKPAGKPDTLVGGAIGVLYDRLGGAKSFLGAAKTAETACPDGVGRFNHFEGGSIYWTPKTGAHEVHGAIRDAWAAQGWETGPLGYPMTDECGCDFGAHQNFQGGSLYWDANRNTVTKVA